MHLILNSDPSLRFANRYLILLIGMGVTYFFLHNLALAIDISEKFNQADFMISDFRIGNDGNPFLTVVVKAGGTVPQGEDTSYSYVFVTDDGTYAVTSDWMYPMWHTHLITLDEKNCIGSIDMKGGAEVGGMVKVTKTNVTRVDKVMTVEFIISKDDGSICADKIFDSSQ